ncbi:MAG TPA: ATPase domain-containing protein [Chthonomonadaceae bacterium]|nr:ATPase domain-containing protein [Chthonomonadaceae bacterium]
MTQDCSAYPEKVPTGTPGLDAVLQGGLLRGRLYLLQGDPGTGKTTIALRFLLSSLERGERALYITLSETRAELEAVARSHGWDIARLPICDLSSTEASLRAETQYTIFHPADVELGETTQAILGQVESVLPRNVIFDGLSEMRLLSGDPLRYRRQMLSLKQYFADKGITVLLLDDRSTPLAEIQPESIVSGIIDLEQFTPIYGGTRRRLFVQKVRGATYLGGFHDYDIHTGGAVVYPRLAIDTHRRPEMVPSGAVPSNISGLDQLLGGGLEYGTTTLILGPSGVGKSTVALQYVAAALTGGQRAAVYTFDEVLHTLFARAEKLCAGFRDFTHTGHLRVVQVDPAELTPGAFADDVRRAVEENDTRIVVIDSLNGYMSSMPEERFVSTHLHELFAFLNQRGVITILVVAQHGSVSAPEASVDISYLADTVLLMRYFEANAEICQAIGVFKKRTGPHERTLRELRITETGIQIGEPLRQFWGIMTGVPQYGSSLTAPQERPA